MMKPTSVMKNVTAKKDATNGVVKIAESNVKSIKKRTPKRDATKGVKTAESNVKPIKKRTPKRNVSKGVKTATKNKVTDISSTKDNRKEKQLIKDRMGKVATALIKNTKKPRKVTSSQTKPTVKRPVICILC